MAGTKFTVTSIQSLPDGKHVDPATQGLYLWVRGTSRTWQFRFMKEGKAATISLGSLKRVGLAEARALATKHRAALNEGIDPKAVTTKAKADGAAKVAATFRADTEAYLRHYRGEWSRQHALLWVQSMERHVLPVIGDRDTATLTVADLVGVLEPIWTSINETAVRLHGRIRAVIDYAIDTDDSHRFTGANPADRVLKRLPRGARPEEKPRLSLPFTEAPAFYARLKELPQVQARALQFLLLCCTPRTGEVIPAVWGEIDIDDKVFHVPASRMKSRKARDIALSDAALELLASIRPPGAQPTDFIFVGRAGKWIDGQLQKFSGHIADGSMQVLVNSMGIATDIHGLRATFRTWVSANAATVRDHDAAEICLDHVIGTKVIRAYDRADMLAERQDLARRWATYLTGPAEAAR